MQNIRAVALAPWLFLPGVAIVVTVLAFNFVLRPAVVTIYHEWAKLRMSCQFIFRVKR